MLIVVTCFLWLSICLYLLLGGADFGAGILELITKGEDKARVRRIMYKAIGPVWEANHMWLIITIVILFVGFPVIYSTLSVYLHIPLVIMLLGIIARGTAFAFRNYDAVEDEWQHVYTRIFTLSSAVTPFFLGVIAAATVSGSIDPEARDFLSAYLFSWLTWVGAATGLFTVMVCGYLASVYALVEVREKEDFRLLKSKARVMVVLTAIAAVLVLVAASYERVALPERILGERVSQVSLLLAAGSLVLSFWALRREKLVWLCLFAGFQVTMMLIAATWPYYPAWVLFHDGTFLSLTEHAGAEKTIHLLGTALLLGSLLILPALGYLMYVFKKQADPEAGLD